MCHQCPNPDQGCVSPIHIHTSPAHPEGTHRQANLSRETRLTRFPRFTLQRVKEHGNIHISAGGMSFLMAQQSRCTSAAANPASGWSGGALPSLQLHQDFQSLQEDPVDRLLLVAQMDLWGLVGLVDPERKRGQISAGFLRAMLVRKKKEIGNPLTICPTSPVSPFSPGGPGRPCGGAEGEF